MARLRHHCQASLRSMPLRQHWLEQPLDRRRETVTALLAVDDRLIGHPIELDCPAPALIGMVAVPGFIGALEYQQRPAGGLDLGGVILQIRAVAQEPQTPRRALPGII